MPKKKSAQTTSTSKKTKSKRKIIDPFSKKDWFEVKAPSMFTNRNIGLTVCNRSGAGKLAADSLKGRVFKVSLGDLKSSPQASQTSSEDEAFRIFKLKVEDLYPANSKFCLTSFNGMTLSRDKLCSLVKKWHTLIEAFIDVKTIDGYLLRLFSIGFTKRRPNQISKTSYTTTAQTKLIRKKMVEIMSRETVNCDLKTLVSKLIPDVIGKEIEKGCSGIYPLQNVFIRKVKMLKAGKLDTAKLLELHGGVDSLTPMLLGATSTEPNATITAATDTGIAVEPADKEEKKD